MVTGNTPSKKNERYWATEDVPFIKPGDIDESAVTYLADGTEYIADCAIGKARCVGAGAVLVTCIGTIAKIAVVNCNCIAFNQQINAIDVDRNVVDPQYLAYALKANNTRLKMLANAPVVPIINKRQFESFVLLIHSDLNVQREIVSQFTAIESQRQKLDEELCHLDNLVKSRFIEMFKGYARGGNTVALSELCEFVTVGIANAATHAYADDGIVMLRNLSVRENYLDDSDLIKINPDFAAKYSKKTLKAGDILVTRTGYPGIACVVPEKYAGCQTFTTLIARLKSNAQIIPLFLSFWINSPAGKEFVEHMKAGSSQQNFGATSLKLLEVPLPPLSLQQEFAAFVAQVDKLKESGVGCVAITLGARGSMVFCGNETIESVPPKTRAIDTTCAGDTYIGAMVAGYARGLSLADSVALATKASAMATTKVGAQQSIPTLAEVE